MVDVSPEPFLRDVPPVRSFHRRPGRVELGEDFGHATGLVMAGDVSMVVFQRVVPESVRCGLSHWAPGAERFDAMVDLRDFDVEAAVRPPADESGRWLVEDLRLICEGFARISGSERFRFAAGPVDHDNCRKFHVDHVRLRLVTTYVGPGTEWVREPDVVIEALDHPDDCPCDDPFALVRNQDAVIRASSGDLLLMKGELFGGSARGQVHRSPPMMGSGLHRYVVTLTVPGRP
jgi:hypothetical protein